MTTRTLFLATGSALVLAASGAMADNNAVWLQQIGVANSALIEQPGENNRAGRSTDGNINNFQAVTQNGDENALTVTQSGNQNRAGTSAGGFSGQMTQTGARNQLDLDQTGNDNQLTTFQQFAAPLASLNPTNTGTNQATVLQSSNGNLVGTLRQQQNNVANAAPNVMSIEQSGGDLNSVIRARQEQGHDNAMSLGQTGTRNMIFTASQFGTGNDMTAVFSGNNNGDDDGDGIVQAFGSGQGTFADDVGVAQADLIQNGVDNFIDVLVTGNRTYYGIEQLGDRNRVDPITITGTRNELGIRQQGNDNLVTVSDIATFGNNIGIRQFQDNNTATVTLNPSAAGSNKFGIYQDGLSNAATVTISDGGNNGIVSAFVALTGPALTVSGTAGWERGLVKQLGDLNTAGLTISGADNGFGTLQDGASNQLTSAQTGSGNVVAVAQLGNSNMSSTSQNGTGNNAGIMQ